MTGGGAGGGTALGAAPGVGLASGVAEASSRGVSEAVEVGEPMPPRTSPLGVGEPSPTGAAEGCRISVPLATIPTTAASNTAAALAATRSGQKGRSALSRACGADGIGAAEGSMSVRASLAAARSRQLGHADAWMATSRAGSSRAPSMSHLANSSCRTLTSSVGERSPGCGGPSDRQAPHLVPPRRTHGGTAPLRAEGDPPAPTRPARRPTPRRGDRVVRHPRREGRRAHDERAKRARASPPHRRRALRACWPAPVGGACPFVLRGLRGGGAMPQHVQGAGGRRLGPRRPRARSRQVAWPAGDRRASTRAQSHAGCAREHRGRRPERPRETDRARLRSTGTNRALPMPRWWALVRSGGEKCTTPGPR